ncbi:MAG TPA: diacylglycerol kinase family protein [Deinococcales bacterium]|nr:diacylglycerol kinase family protein [Deinococcales bacterium]
MDHLQDRTGEDARTAGPERGPLSRFRRSVGFAWQGLRHAWETQPNLRLQAGLAVLACSAAVMLDAGPVAVVLSWGFVMAMELLNTAVETVVDLVSPARHPLAGLAKDLAAGAVLIAAVCAAAVNALLLVPALWRLLMAGP